MDIKDISLIAEKFDRLSAASGLATSGLANFAKQKISMDTSQLSKVPELLSKYSEFGKSFKNVSDISKFTLDIAKSTTALAANTLQYGFNTAAKKSNTLATIAEIAQNVKSIATDSAIYIAIGAETIARKAKGVIELVAQKINIALGLSETAALGPILLIIAAVAAFIAIFTVLFLKCKPFHDFVVAAVTFLKTIAIAVFNNIKDTVFSVFETISTYIMNSIANIKQIFNGIIEFFSGIFTGNWQKAFQGLRDIVGGVFNQMVNMVKAPINLIIDAINGLIGNINNAISLASNIPGIGGALKGVAIPRIPKLAYGGVVDGATLALIGESGREAVMPLENNTGWIDKLAERISASGGTGEINVNSTVFLDGKQIYSAVQKQANRQSRNCNRPVFN